jgi:hypothetical protein
MAKPLLLLLHGIGSHSDSWADSIKAQLNQIASTFPEIAANGQFSEQVEIKALRYDKLFDDQPERWRRRRPGEQLCEGLGDRAAATRLAVEQPGTA